jgi:murein L,D-transpeptidase YcbB/YkuD
MLRRVPVYILLLLFTAASAHALSEAGHRPQVAHAVNSLYEANQWQELWVREGQPTPAAQTALRLLGDARSHGLDDDLYGIDLLYLLHEKLTQGDAEHAQNFDMGLSMSLLRLIGDLRPEEFDTVPQEELANAVLDAIHSGQLEQFLDGFLPQDPQYRALREVLQTYELRAHSRTRVTIGEGPKLKIGDVGPRVARLRARLLGSFHFAYGEDQRNTFDGLLERAVKEYQEANGLAADGIAGPSTVRHLDMSDDERIARIKLNLHRWRQLPVDLGRNHVLVNIPEYRLRYVRDREQSLSMRVVVGSKSSPTPELNDEIEYLVINPYWYVPRSILRREMLPTIQKNSNYLSENSFELLADDRAIQPEEVDFGDVDFSRFPYRVRQKPGSHNALGTIKFLLPNTSNIYLHDSPAKSLFARSDRAFSHGCIRLEHPDLLAQALLEKDAEWPESRISSTIAGGERQQVNLDEPVPVYLAYFTVRVLDNGNVAFFDDVYGRDSARLANIHRQLSQPVEVEVVASRVSDTWQDAT